jgi:hypothetical protein
MIINTKINSIRYDKRKWFALLFSVLNIIISYFFHSSYFTLIITGVSFVSVVDIFFRKIISEIYQRWEKIVHNWKGLNCPISFEVGGWIAIFTSLFVNIYLIFPNPNTNVMIAGGIFIWALVYILSLDNEK